MCFPFIISGQNKFNKHFDSKNISVLELNLPWISSINITNSKSEFIEVGYTTRGEYKNFTFLSSKLKGDSLFVEEKLVSNSTNFNDKLSVHKNHSTSLNISLPEKLILQLYVENASTNIYGKVYSIIISQPRGEIYLSEWNSPGLIKTISADIIFNNPNIKILSNSKNKLNCGESDSHDFLEIKSVSGKINCITF